MPQGFADFVKNKSQPNNKPASTTKSGFAQFVLNKQAPTPPAQPVEEKPGFFKRAFAGIGKGIVNDLIKPATVGLIETPLQGLVSGARSIQATPDILRGKTEQANKTMSNPILGIKPLQGMTPIEAATGPGLSAATSLFGVKGKASGIAERLAAKQAGKAEQKLLQETIDVVRGPVTKKVKEQALLEGRVMTKGVLKQTVVEPSKREQEIAEATKAVVSNKKNATQNIQAIQKEVGRVSESVQAGLEKNNAIFNKKTLKATLSTTKEDSRVVFGSDKNIESSYDAVTDEFMKHVENNPQNLAGLWAARKQFDETIKRKFPNIFNKFGRDDVRANAVQDVRRAVNDYIADHLPQGNPFKQELKRMNLMFEAQDNIASKGATEVGKNALSRFGDKHPFIKKAAKYVLPAAGVGAGFNLFKD